MLKECLSFTIFGDKVFVISDETSYGRNTVVQIDNFYYYLGDEYPGMAAALFAWQEVNNKELSVDQLTQVLIDNNLMSQGI